MKASQAKTKLSSLFSQSVKTGMALDRRKREAPFSIRLTVEERAYLAKEAKGQPLGSYIKECLFDGRSVRGRRLGQSKLDREQVARLLSELGRSQLSNNINQLAKSANMGTLDVSEQVERELLQACTAILAMRDMLISTLGLKPERRQ